MAPVCVCRDWGFLYSDLWNASALPDRSTKEQQWLVLHGQVHNITELQQTGALRDIDKLANTHRENYLTPTQALHVLCTSGQYGG